MHLLASCFGLKFLELGIGTVTVNVKGGTFRNLKMGAMSLAFNFTSIYFWT